jgi:hypothetical protein
VLSVSGALPAALFGAVAADAPGSSAAPWNNFPRQDPDLAEQVVGAAHANFAKVKSLVTEHPTLLHASWDWGFGDWETPLGSASHVGNREIAEFLLGKGARLDIFAAAMLGMTAAVRAMIEAQPGVERALGPHGIPLPAHAKAGGPRAAETFGYLQQLGTAGKGITTRPLESSRRSQFAGRYRVEGWSGPEIEIKQVNPEQLTIAVGKASAWIHHAGGESFYPAGVGHVRIRFDWEEGRAVRLRIENGPSAVVAQRVS